VSRDNVELVRRQYELINSLGRTEGFVDPEELAPDLWERFDPELELHERPDLPDRKVYRGRDTAAATSASRPTRPTCGGSTTAASCGWLGSRPGPRGWRRCSGRTGTSSDPAGRYERDRAFDRSPVLVRA
jgi:hypothetical protein